MKLRVLSLAALALALVPAAAAHPLSGSKTYPDSVGENATAPDITSVVVSNDNARDLTFKIDISNRPQLTSDMLIWGFFDTDQSTKTGDTKGAEADPGTDYVIQLTAGEIDLFKWNGSDFVSGTPETSLTYSYGATGATIHVNAAELGATKAFDFSFQAISGITTDSSGNPDFTNAQADRIPDPGHGELAYTVQAPLLLKQTAFTTSPTAPTAGKRFAASLAGTENDTDGPIKSGTVTCVGKVGKKGVAATHKLVNGIASCYWTVPTKAKGEVFHGTVTITVHGAKLAKSFSAKVR